MIDLLNLNGFIRMLLTMLPFIALVLLYSKTNVKKAKRYKQFLMPFVAVILCIVAMIFLTKIYMKVVDLIQYLPAWINQAAFSLGQKAPQAAQLVESLRDNILTKLDTLITSVNFNFWAFYIANALLMLAYILVKSVLIQFLKLLFKDGSLFQSIAGLFYEYDEATGYWNIKPRFGQARTFLKALFITATVLGIAGVLLSSWMYQKELMTAVYYPVFSIIIVGELYFALNGLTRKELKHALNGEVEETEHVSNYSVMRGVLRRLFPDKLSAENTTVSDAFGSVTTNDELLTKLEASESVAEEAYGRFMRARSEDGLELDFNYLLSGQQLLNGESVLFNNPFHYDLIPYIFYPINRTLLRHKKVLVILGRHKTEEDAENWCREGLTAITNVPTMWNIGLLNEGKQELDVGIITRSDVHDLQMHEANQEFFSQVEFVVLMEPSRLVTTAQVGLNSLVRHCRADGKRLVFCSTDKNCDGLLDALSHILMTSLREVSATNHHKGASSYMIWEADGEHLQHRMLPNLSRYLGMGTELSFAALKNQIPQTKWFGGDVFPVVDIHWITKQYYYDLLRYAELPAAQESIDQIFKVYSDMWSTPVEANQYLTVEDESFNMFEVKRDFSTRASEQGFINVICSDYLLKDYMAENDAIFNADPKAIPYITADYARTVRNVVLRLCLRMSVGLVPEQEIVRELTMIDRDTAHPAESLWNELCKTFSPTGERKGDRPVLRTDGGLFTEDVFVLKRRFNVNAGVMENMYTITDRRFVLSLLGALRLAEYVAEDENGQRQYLGTELQGQIFQKYLPGQFFTFGGKYYEMLRVASDGKVLVRRASEHINGRPFYRQERNYFISQPVDSTVMGECRDMGAIRVTRQFADIRVQTPAYWKMNRYNDFSDATRVGINGIPERVYNNKALLRIDLNAAEALPQGTISTLTLLINEVLRSLLAENQDYLVAVSANEAQIPTTYSLQGEGEFQPGSSTIYLLEDSQMDIGLLDAVERNLNRIFAIICDYLQWHDETMNKPEEEPEAPQPAPETEEPAPAEEKVGLFKRIWRAIKKFFASIGKFFKKIFTAIANFFKKLFKRKKKDAPVEEPAEGMETPETEVTEGEPETEVAEEAPAEEAAEETAEEAAEEVTEEEAAEEVTEEVAEEVTEEVTEEAAEEVAEEVTAEEAAEETEESFESFALFSTDGELGEDIPADPDMPEDVDQPMDTAEGAEGDTVDYEPEQVMTPTAGFQRLPYKERYYLRYGSDEIAATLQLEAVRELLITLGYGNSALTQARKGQDVAKMVEQSFVPNKTGVHYCDFCGCELTGMDYDILADGRERCPSCSRTSIKDLDEFVQLHDTVLKNMKTFFGVRITAPVHVQMVNSKKLHRKLGKTFIPTGKADGRVLGVAIKDKDGYSILIENGAPKLQSTMTMVHEMTHIWQYLNWNAKNIKKTYGKDELEVYEGMSKWVEIQYAYLLNEVATGKREELITRHRDDPYGRGFIKYADKYPLTIGAGKIDITPFDNVKKPL